MVYDGNLTKVVTKKDGKKFTRLVDPRELAGILEEGKCFDTDLLPPNTRYYAIKGQEFALVMEVPPHVRDVSAYCSEGTIKVEKVPMAAACFMFRGTKPPTGEISVNSNLLFGVKSAGITSLDEPLFRFPTSDADHGGTVCWGSLGNLWRMKKLFGLGGTVNRFYTSNFNEVHMYGEHCKAPVYRKRLDEYFQEIAKYPEFKDEWLTPASYKTLREAMKNFFRGIVELP